ncbi:hypothetical protein [Arthrobacter celericrescens]|nr:hypothetical protein [Arthrobacter celericrescens]
MLDGNPFHDASILWDESKARTVIKDGQVISSGALRIAADITLNVPVA